VSRNRGGTHGIEEPIKIIGYADDWIVHTNHKHERVSVFKLKKADTGWTRLDIWIKGNKIEQVRKHKILGLIFDTRMNWNEHILSTNAKAE
jgi:hypothetical protein